MYNCSSNHCSCRITQCIQEIEDTICALEQISNDAILQDKNIAMITTSMENLIDAFLSVDETQLTPAKVHELTTFVSQRYDSLLAQLNSYLVISNQNVDNFLQELNELIKILKCCVNHV